MADVLTPTQRTLLQEFLLAKVRQTFIWGEADCGLYLADWAVAVGHDDPAIAVRGTYSTAEGAAAAIAPLDFLGFVTQCAAACSFPETDAPQDADIAVIDMPTQGQTGAIMTMDSWAFRSPNGLVWTKVATGRLLKAWRVFDA